LDLTNCCENPPPNTASDALLFYLIADNSGVSFEDPVTGVDFRAGEPMTNPFVADSAPEDAVLTDYDRQHFATYLRLLDAESEGADWTEVARIVLRIDPQKEPARARRVWASHLARARWMTEHGFRHLLEE
jgi:Uncharacterized conserved protein (DUF2285)